MKLCVSLILSALMIAVGEFSHAGEATSVTIEGDKLSSCKVIDEGDHLASVQWIAETNTLFVFAKPNLKVISLQGFPIHLNETVEVIREKDAEPVVVDAKGLTSMVGTVKGEGVVVLGIKEEQNAVENLVFQGHPKPVMVLRAQGGVVPVENQAAEIKVNGNVFALAVRNGNQAVPAGGNIFIKRGIPFQIAKPEPVSLNGKPFAKDPLAADFFEEWKLQIGDENFVLTTRNDGGIQEFEKDGRIYRFLVMGTPDQLRVISEQDSPERFKEEILFREMPFDEVNQPRGQHRTSIGAGGIRIIAPAPRIEPRSIEKIGERQ